MAGVVVSTLHDPAVLQLLLETQQGGDKCWVAICASPAVVVQCKGWLGKPNIKQ